ncbi:ER membrane protein complex subunit 3 [Zancudomyces culisetae]|uniref:ER membrane protein complex subunit 3 n=1 Tax=Zancudomyces culisetae TaxID=1213189 RepID=A0A1R1PYU6_ZANCU|nr:ER membrane protein complex subunit 3 [Zancudomyces culisetae]|eukprot:OMH86099.1 ER membrane protein complex subunit 3 [Zancudomyces culisetae]
MILVGVLRHQLTVLFTKKPKQSPTKAMRQGNMMLRAGTLIEHAGHVPQNSFEERRVAFCKAFEDGEYLENKENKDKGAPNPMSDPKAMESMLDGVKGQMMTIVPQTIIMGWIQYFFSGFILIKIPFPLGMSFKSMLQSGINTPYMDATWVSSLSWYFLNLFGLGGIFTLILGANSTGSGLQDMQAMSSMGMPQQQQQQQPGPQDYHKLFLGIKENLELVHYQWDLEDVENRVLKMYGKKNHDLGDSASQLNSKKRA